MANSTLIRFFRENTKVRAAFAIGWQALRLQMDEGEHMRIAKRAMLRAAALYAQNDDAKPDVLVFLFLCPAIDDARMDEFNARFGPVPCAIDAEMEGFFVLENMKALESGDHPLSPTAAEAGLAMCRGFAAEHDDMKDKIATRLAAIAHGMQEDTAAMNDLLRRVVTLEAMVKELDQPVEKTLLDIRQMAQLKAYPVGGLKPN